MTSKLTINLVVGILGAIATVLLVGAFALILDGKAVPETVWTLAGTTIGALASLLVSTRAGDVPAPPATTAPDPNHWSSWPTRANVTPTSADPTVEP